MSDLQNIWDKQQHKNVDSKMLQDYFEGKLSAEQQHLVEQSLNEEDAFTNDAFEGLAQKQNDVGLTIYEINKKINKKLKQKTKRARLVKNDSNTIIAILVTLAIIVIGFVVIKMYLKN